MRLRFTGTDSKIGDCPALHESTDTQEVVVQGRPLTDPDDLAQLHHFGPRDAAVVVPRELLVNWGPKEADAVPKLIDKTEFARLFRDFEHSAWHLETRKGYASDRDETFEEFLRTGIVAWEEDMAGEWHRTIRRQADAGKAIGRVRVVDNPPTDGQRYLLGYAACNAATGEAVGCLWREDAQRIRLLEEDFWIFDARLVVVLHFNDADELASYEVKTEPAEVVRYSIARDTATHHAVPYERLAAQVAAAE
ncbi:DUF6879 family protein [Streptomyces sp. NPDC046465]|uniref:DUF6879 family protein n=1 Tax=Streptomyces sp. NPDC046465 TaxID=3155810 RepID=UPI0033CE81DC